MVSISEHFGPNMNDKLIMRLYQDAYHEVMMPHLIVKSGSPILEYKTTDGVDSKIKQKFAELLVKECANVIHKKIGPKTALDVLNHFGLE